MQVHITIHLDIAGNKVMKRANFNINKEDDVVRVAYEFICQIKKETGFRDTVIEEVILNNKNDITESIRTFTIHKN